MTSNKSKPLKKRNYIIAVVVIIIVCVIGTVIYMSQQKDSTTVVENKQPITSTSNSLPDNSSRNKKLIIGSQDIKVTLVEYGDFKCPLCTKFSQSTEKQIRKEYVDSGKINIEYKTLPIIADDSKVAAEAAYCANDQQKFTEFHDAVYDYMWNNYYRNGDYSIESKNLFTQQKLSEIASGAGIDGSRITQCLQAGTNKSLVEADIQSAKTAGITGTPTFLIGSQKVSGSQPFSIFKPLIDSKLK